MSVKEIIMCLVEQVAPEHGKTLAPLIDGLVLADCGPIPLNPIEYGADIVP